MTRRDLTLGLLRQSRLKNQQRRRILARFTAILILMLPAQVCALSANFVHFEFTPRGRFRVVVVYTVPELKELREVRVDFGSKKEAETYYFSLVRGADFYLPEAKSLRFSSPVKKAPAPW